VFLILLLLMCVSWLYRNEPLWAGQAGVRKLCVSLGVLRAKRDALELFAAIFIHAFVLSTGLEPGAVFDAGSIVMQKAL
jgi:hypothetical protein